MAIPYGIAVPLDSHGSTNDSAAIGESSVHTVPPLSGQGQRPERPHHRPPYPTGYAPEPHAGSEAGHAPSRMPSVYRGPGRWLRYWYLPAAALLAAGIAFAIVTVVDILVAEPESEVEPAGSTTVFSETPMPTVRATPTPEGTPEIPDGGGTGSAFAAGQTAIVTGTGDCLNMRGEPSIEGAIVTCLPDGTSLSIIGGPEFEGSRTWWRVESSGQSGWVAEEYLTPP